MSVLSFYEMDGSPTRFGYTHMTSSEYDWLEENWPRSEYEEESGGESGRNSEERNPSHRKVDLDRNRFLKKWDDETIHALST